MELIYFWIDGYKNLNNCGVSLNSKYNCSATLCSDNILRLVIKENEDYCTPFDEHLNITTIVGENGSGKSNIVNALSYILRSITLAHKTNFKSANTQDDYDKENLDDCKYCLVIKDWSGNSEYLYSYTNIEIDETKNNLKTLNIDKIKQNLDLSKMLPKLPYTVAKFQPFLRREDDSSLQFQFWNDIFRTTKIKLKNYFYYDRFRLYDSARNLIELFKFNNDILGEDLKIFEGLNQKLHFDMYSPYLDVYEALQWVNNRVQITKKVNYDITQIISRSISTLSGNARRMANKNINSLAENVLPKLFFAYAMGEILETLNNANLEEKEELGALIKFLPSNGFPKLQERKQFYQNVQKIIKQKRLKDMLQVYLDYEGDERGNSKLKEFLGGYYEIVKGQKGTILKLKDEYMIEIKDLYVCPLSLPSYITDIEKLKSISKNLYKKSSNKLYDFMSLSTGEQRVLKFMADIYIVANLHKLDKNTDFYTNIFIFDEMDLSWHPEWQRKMVYYILNIFKKIFDEKSTRKINIIFTTHSPFILSDMPKNNVILIKKHNIDEGPKIIEQPIKNTFGANIHSLFEESFFLNSTIGEFAKNEINSIIEAIPRVSSHKEFNVIEQRINIVGEPIIQSRLLKNLYDVQFATYGSTNIQETCKNLTTKNKELKREIQILKEQISKKKNRPKQNEANK